MTAYLYFIPLIDFVKCVCLVWRNRSESIKIPNELEDEIT